MSTFGARSGALSTIFGFEKSMKWIIREGLNGISRAGSGASIARGLKKSRGLRKGGSSPVGDRLSGREPYRLRAEHRRSVTSVQGNVNIEQLQETPRAQ